MAKSGKKESSAQAAGSNQANTGLLDDIAKLKKHMSLIVDRLGKGLRPAGGAPGPAAEGAAAKAKA